MVEMLQRELGRFLGGKPTTRKRVIRSRIARLLVAVFLLAGCSPPPVIDFSAQETTISREDCDGPVQQLTFLPIALQVTAWRGFNRWKADHPEYYLLAVIELSHGAIIVDFCEAL